MSQRTLPAATHPAASRRPRGAFTLAELLVVIGIIILLVSILIPVVSRVRVTAQTADTASMIRALDSAVQTYYSDHQAWPGPLSDRQLGPNPGEPPPAVRAGSDGFFRDWLVDDDTSQGVTGTENLVLGLLGGLVYDSSIDEVVYDPAAVGRGPVRLAGRTPGGFRPYVDLPAGTLSTHAMGDADMTYAGMGPAGLLSGRFVEEHTAARDSIIPEFVDRYSNPLPVLYMRATSVGRITPDRIASSQGRVIATDDPAGRFPGVYNQLHIEGYVGITGIGTNTLGVGKSPDPYFVQGARVPRSAAEGNEFHYYHGLRIFDGGAAGNSLSGGVNIGPVSSADDLRSSMQRGEPNHTFPYDIRAYLLDPAAAAPRQADRYVIISAGPDRVYGTDDDVTSFGSVRP